MGPPTPGPGTYPCRSSLSKQASGVHLPLPRPANKNPGPGEYNPDLSLTQEASFAWASPQRTSKRTPFGAGFSEEPSGSQVEVKMEKQVPGPKFSLGVRRDHLSMCSFAVHKQEHGASAIARPESENYHALYGAYGSVTPREAPKSTMTWKPRTKEVPAVCDNEN